MTPSETQLAILEQLYIIHGQFTGTLDHVCEKFCSACCTCNVTLTTLEARKILFNMDDIDKQNMRGNLQKQIEAKRFIPKITTNQLADICMSGDDPPEEPMDPEWGQCPLLQGNSCTIYDVRPFACRCMVSSRQCADNKAAEIGDFTLTVNHVFLQYIEHIDQNGFSGNLSDILTYIIANETVHQTTLVKNSPLNILMIPPEHRETIKPILSAINAIKV